MDPIVDVNALVEKAKADASATGASKAPNKDPLAKTGVDQAAESIFGVSDESIDRLLLELEGLAEREDTDQATKFQDAIERGRHVKIAKLLAAVDVLSGVLR